MIVEQSRFEYIHKLEVLYCVFLDLKHFFKGVNALQEQLPFVYDKLESLTFLLFGWLRALRFLAGSFVAVEYDCASSEFSLNLMI